MAAWTDSDDDWFILRMQGRYTLTLADSLDEDGFEVWTPSLTRRFRAPRATAKRDIKLPMMPSYVFVRAPHLYDMLELAALPEKPRRAGGMKPAHRDFSVFHYGGRIPMIPDAGLEPLREAEIDALPRKRQFRYASGAAVRVTDGSFGGMHGTVEFSDRHGATVWLSLFGRHMRVKIPTSYLREVGANKPQSVRKDTAARAA